MVSIPKGTIDSPSLIIVQLAIIIKLSHIEESCPENKLFNQLVKGFLVLPASPCERSILLFGTKKEGTFPGSHVRGSTTLSGEADSRALERTSGKEFQGSPTLAFRCCFQELGEFLEVLFSFESVFTGLSAVTQTGYKPVSYCGVALIFPIIGYHCYLFSVPSVLQLGSLHILLCVVKLAF